MNMLTVLVFLFIFLLIVALLSWTTYKVPLYKESNDTTLPEKPVAPISALKLSYVHSPLSKRGPFGELLSSRAEEAEDYINRSLSGLGANYIIFPDLIINKPGIIHTTEIDHVVISPFGIFCIETKSHGGSIYGSTRDKQWKQYLQGKPYPFYNPLFQNNNHAKAMHHLLEGKVKSRVRSYVIFPNAKKVKVNSALVFNYAKELVNAIDQYRTIIYTNQELSDIAYVLSKYTHEYEQVRSEHIENVQRYLQKIK